MNTRGAKQETGDNDVERKSVPEMLITIIIAGHWTFVKSL